MKENWPRRTCRQRPQPGDGPPWAGCWAAPFSPHPAGSCSPTPCTYCEHRSVLVRTFFLVKMQYRLASSAASEASLSFCWAVVERSSERSRSSSICWTFLLRVANSLSAWEDIFDYSFCFFYMVICVISWQVFFKLRVILFKYFRLSVYVCPLKLCI